MGNLTIHGSFFLMAIVNQKAAISLGEHRSQHGDFGWELKLQPQRRNDISSTISWHQNVVKYPHRQPHINAQFMHISSIKDLSKIYTVYIRPRWKKIAEVDRSPAAIACHVSIMEGFNLTEAASGLKLDDHRMVTPRLPNILNGWVTMLIWLATIQLKGVIQIVQINIEKQQILWISWWPDAWALEP